VKATKNQERALDMARLESLHEEIASNDSAPRRRCVLGGVGSFSASRLVAGLALAIGLGLASLANAQQAPSVIAQFTTAIESREPVDQVTFVGNDVRKIFFFTDLRGLEGKTVIHRWTHDGSTVAEVRFEVGAPRWRVWSSKELLPGWIGDWTVEIVTGEGEVLGAETLTHKPPDT